MENFQQRNNFNVLVFSKVTLPAGLSIYYIYGNSQSNQRDWLGNYHTKPD